MAKYFEKLISKDERFEIIGKVLLGLVCFRVKGSNEFNERLIKSITDEGLIFMVPAKIGEQYFIRFAICASSTEARHLDFAYEIITKHVVELQNNQS